MPLQPDPDVNALGPEPPSVRLGRLIDSGRMDASMPAPGVEHWHRLLQGLLYAQEVSEGCEGPNAERTIQWGAIAALKAVLAFLRSSPIVTGSELEEPLWILTGDLLSLEQGNSPRRFERANSDQKSGKSIARSALEWNAAFAIEELKKTGMPLPTAKRRVAGAVRKTGIRARHDASLASTVGGWRDRLRRWDIKVYEDELQRFRADYSIKWGKDGSPKERADFLLELIENAKLEFSEMV